MRLTKAIKDEIQRKVILNAFGNRYDALAESRRAVALDAYDHLYGKYMEAMEKLPEYAFSHYAEVTVYLEGMGHTLRFNAARDFNFDNLLFLSASYNADGTHIVRPMFYNCPAHHRVLEAGSYIFLEVQGSIRLEDNLMDEQRALARDLRAVLASCSTDRQLIRAWPEGEVWIQDVCRAAAVALPAVNIDRLNDRLCRLIGPESPTCPEEAAAEKEEVEG